MQKDLDSTNLSVVGKASFLEGLQQHGVNRMHSTALDEDVLEDKCPNEDHVGRIHGKGGAVKRKQTQEVTMSQKRVAGMDKKKQRKTQMDKGKATVEMEEMETSTTLQEAQQQEPKLRSQLVHSGRKNRTGYPQTSGLRSVRTPKKQRAKEPGAAKHKKPQTQVDSHTGADPKNRIPTSEEELARDDLSEVLTPKKATMSTLNTGSTSDKASNGLNRSGTSTKRSLNDQQRRRGRGIQQRPELDLVLEAFVKYIDHYRESVDSKVIKKSISSFSSIVKEHLEEKIRYTKELKVLKKTNAQVRTLGQTKTQRLLDTKYELMRAKKQICLLQKEKSQRELRLSDLRTGQAFLQDLSELNRQYLDYRCKNPKENEMYGASALPALVQEINHLRSTKGPAERIQ